MKKRNRGKEKKERGRDEWREKERGRRDNEKKRRVK